MLVFLLFYFIIIIISVRSFDILIGITIIHLFLDNY